MSRTILKYVLQQGVHVPLELPSSAQFLHLHQQRDIGVCLWFLVDTEAPKIIRFFSTIVTGCQAPPLAAKYMGTAHLQEGSCAVHVFEVYGGEEVQHTLPIGF